MYDTIVTDLMRLRIRFCERSPQGNNNKETGNMEIWEMTQEQYIQKQEKYGRWAAPEDFKDETWAHDWRGNQKIRHRYQVRKALKDGKQVPETVLQDYPDLRQTTTPTPETEQPEEISICKGKNTVNNRNRLPEAPAGYEKAYLISGGYRGKGFYYIQCESQA
jgi:hypothetical protein